ncbi:MAG: TIR domain-containing protein [Tissierellia bacterium]|nr:TIR domain-containing protein [Tissierellia bacterium]
MDIRNPKIFISYSWEDEIHKEWVVKFVDKLREDGVDAILDRYDLLLGDRLPHFMEKSITEADYVLIICTPNYKERSDNRSGGVGYEGHIISDELLSSKNEKKFIPIIKKGSTKMALPKCLAGKLAIDFTNETNWNDNYKDLITTIYGQNRKPPIGTKPSYVSRDVDYNTSDDEFKEISIFGIITDGVTIPRMDSTRGSDLYKVPFRLSRTPSELWEKLFINAWNYPPRFTSMHRPGIASVYGDKIVLDGTTIEEIQKYHRDTLTLCVEKANQEEEKVMNEEKRRKNIENQRKEEHYNNVRNLVDQIKF